MAKESGMAWTECTIDDSADAAKIIVNDVTSLDFSTPRNLLDWTGLDKSAIERGLGLADFSITVNCIFNDAAASSFAVFKATTGERDVDLEISGQTLDNDCYVSDVAWGRAADGSFTIAGTLQLMDGTVPTWS